VFASHGAPSTCALAEEDVVVGGGGGVGVGHNLQPEAIGSAKTIAATVILDLMALPLMAKGRPDDGDLISLYLSVALNTSV
jgi:hypothetical protein